MLEPAPDPRSTTRSSAALAAALAIGCTHAPPSGEVTRAANSPAAAHDDASPSCALIDTDDDIPSGSATAGALYVADAARGKELLTRDVVAVARGFFEAGQRCVVVLDSHDGAIDPEPLRAMGVRVATPSSAQPWTWPFLGSEVEHASVAALVGYHSRADQTDGFRPHTINDGIRELRVDGSVVGEVTAQIMGLAAFGVPVVLVSGDMNATSEAASLVPSIEKVTVRWRDADGAARFMESDEAARKLRDAARKGAASPAPVLQKAAPIEISLQLRSRPTMARRSATLTDSFRAHAGEMGWDPARLDGFDLASTLAVDRDRATWSAPNLLAAFVSISFAASHLRGEDNWALVTKGYDAYAAGRHEEALGFYEQALQVNPDDAATRCRIGAAHQALGRLDDARTSFRHGFEHDDEIGDATMRSWCAIGLAETELATGNVAAAREAARRVLTLPDAGGKRHAHAQTILTTIGPAGP